jgi:dihydrofolate reductase
MRKLIAGINVTLDGVCDHTAVIPDDEISQHYNDLMKSVGGMLWGRITYQLMESYWPPLVKNPSGDKTDDDFAIFVEEIPKIVFSRTLKSVDWKNARLVKRGLKEEILDLKQQAGKDLLVGSRSLIAAALNLGLVDEFQLCVHPVIAGKGMRLFENMNDRITFKVLKTKTFRASGATVFYYEPVKK